MEDSRPILVRGGLLIDGTGAAPFHGDVFIRGDRIEAIGNCDAPDAEVVDAQGLAVAPGFIDVHSHSDYTLLVDPRAVSSIKQGVTLEIVGNCGHGCAPLAHTKLAHLAVYGPVQEHGWPPATVAGYLEKLRAVRPAVNVLTLVPNGQLRLGAVGLEPREARSDERDMMRRSLTQALDEGAAGFSTGLEYAQEMGASEDEVTDLARLAGKRGGIYATHTRNRDDGALEAVREAIRTAEKAEVDLQISHISPRSGPAAIAACLDEALTARARGNPVNFDMHTRTFGFTHLKNIVPASVLDGNGQQVAERLRRQSLREKLRRHDNLITRCPWEKVVLARSSASPELAGLTFSEIGSRLGLDPHDAALDLLAAETGQLLYPMVILRTYDEEQLFQTYLADDCMIGSDATALAPDGPLAVETFYGAYTWASWFWRRVVREKQLLRPEEAVRRLTSLPARVFSLKDRGRLAAGYKADVVIFKMEAFRELGTVEQPNLVAEGVRHLFVNGVHTIADGQISGLRGGVVLAVSP
jgi:N-acyl-D-amino-acid deacylase